MPTAPDSRQAIALITPPCRAWVPALSFGLIYLAAALLVDPRGGFPLNDDWSYTRSAFRWGMEQRMQVDEWSAPNLVGQALYGGCLVRLGGPSFTTLRLSTLFLAWGTACLLWATCRRLGAPASLSSVLALSFALNPVAFSLSFTFMTEIPFLFFVSLGFYAWLEHGSEKGRLWLSLSGAALGYAYLLRQTALLFLFALGCALVVAIPRKDRRFGLRNLAVLLGTALPFVLGHALWAGRARGFTSAAARKFELLQHLTAEQIAGNLFGAAFYLAFFLAPAVTLLAPRLWRTGKIRTALGAALLWGAVALTGLAWFHTHYSRGPYLPAAAYHRQMPFLLNILYDTGVGPLTLDPTYYGPPPTPVYPNVWLAVTIGTTLALVLLGGVLTLSIAARRVQGPLLPYTASMAAGLALGGVLVFEIVFSHLQEGGLFDRHLLTALLALIWATAVLCGGENGSPSPARRIAAFPIACVLLAAMAAFSVAGTHDYLAWNRLRWKMGEDLLAQGVPPLSLSAGFEFNAWHNYDTFRARGNVGKVYYWWYDSPEHVIAMEPQEGYRITERREWYSWVHRQNLPIFSLQKNP